MELFIILSSKDPGIELVGCTIYYVLTFVRISETVFQSDYHFAYLPAMYKNVAL